MDLRIKSAISNNRNLLEPEAMELLKEYDLPILPYFFHKNRENVLVNKEIPYPAVLKVVSRDIFHKSEVGGVKLGVRTFSELETALSSMEENILNPIICSGTELRIADARFVLNLHSLSHEKQV